MDERTGRAKRKPLKAGELLLSVDRCPSHGHYAVSLGDETTGTCLEALLTAARQEERDACAGRAMALIAGMPETEDRYWIGYACAVDDYAASIRSRGERG